MQITSVGLFSKLDGLLPQEKGEDGKKLQTPQRPSTAQLTQSLMLGGVCPRSDAAHNLTENPQLRRLLYPSSQCENGVTHRVSALPLAPAVTVVYIVSLCGDQILLKFSHDSRRS